MTALVIPIKKLDEVKQRLGVILTREERTEVCLYLLRRVLSEAIRCGAFDRIYLISPQKDILCHLPEFSEVTAICSEEDQGLNEAACIAARRLQEDGVDTMVFLHGDLPYVTGEDLQALCREAGKAQVVLVPDSTETGTTGVALTPPDCLSTCFGPGSFQKHRERCRKEALPFQVYRNERLGRDLDLPQDWENFCREFVFTGK